MGGSPEISIVVCVLNEEDTIPLFFEKIVPILEQHTESYEFVFVNDGSTDSSLDILNEYAQARSFSLTTVNLSRNFGKDVALSAGIDHATGKAIIPIDVDLQDPPELIKEMLEKWRNGADSVIAIRSDRSDDSLLKRKSANAYYRLISKMSKITIHQNAGDFRLMDRKVIEVVKNMPEKSRFMKGIFSFPGFKSEYVYFKRQPRSAGETKWSFGQLWNFALDGIFSFSTAPLRVWTYLGALMATGSILYLLYILIRTLILGVDVPGYASLISFLLFFNSITLIGIGIMGEYIGRIFEEVKNRPLYVVEDICSKSKKKS